MNILEQLKKLDEQRNTLLANAKKEALEKVEIAIASEKIGTHSDSPTRFMKGLPQKRKTVTRNTDASRKRCPVCDIGGHDARTHRGQGKNKRKFTAAELKGLGLA